MNDQDSRSDGPIEDVVFEAAQRLLAERSMEESEVTAWVTGSEIAHDTGIDKAAVLDALRSLGDGRLHIKSAAADKDIEVLGVDEGH
ncbi:MAG: hypothetical protein QOI51_2577 [Nocardioidaceae bacterium]|jgi:hypothetical protein|nr:hypothetical protein [Nocardioidaceae bacterium]